MSITDTYCDLVKLTPSLLAKHRWRAKARGSARIQKVRARTQSRTRKHKMPAKKKNPQEEKYLGEAGCEKHALEELPHLLKKLVDVRSFQHVHLENTSLRPGWGRTKLGAPQK